MEPVQEARKPNNKRGAVKGRLSVLIKTALLIKIAFNQHSKQPSKKRRKTK